MNLASVSFRSATLDDVSVLLTFEQQLISYERAFDSTLASNIHYYDIAGIIRDPDSELIVAETPDEVIGCGYSRILKADSRYIFTNYALIGFVYVAPEFRGNRVSTMVLRKLVDWSKGRGIEEIRLRVYADNVSASKVYRGLGFRDDFVEMRLPF